LYGSGVFCLVAFLFFNKREGLELCLGHFISAALLFYLPCMGEDYFDL
jgi:hypothetical protein